MTTMNIENQVCDAIQILAERAINQAPYDKTISALIVECVDTTKGKYKIKHQDALYYATSDNIELEYRKGTEVYILIPGNDFSKEKKILGAVKDMGEEYNQMLEDSRDGYYEVGESITFNGGGLCSYLAQDAQVIAKNLLVEKSFTDNIDTIDSKIRMSMEIQTTLPHEHRGKGTYGIAITITAKSASDNVHTDYTYLFDTDNFNGDPYGYSSPYLQKIDKIDLGGKIPVAIKEISIFSNGFVDKEKEELNRADNIFIRNIKLNCLASKDQRHLSINASNGYTLSKAIPELNFTAVPMIGSRAVVNEKSNFYWFSEDGSVDVNHENYSSIGGKGWNWINKDNTNSNSLKITLEDQIAKSLKYKCVYTTDDFSTEEEFIINNSDSEWLVEIVSSPNGETNFILSRGKADLVCNTKQNGSTIEPANLTYHWNKVDNGGVTTLLTENEELANQEGYLETLITHIENELENKNITLEQNYANNLGNEYNFILNKWKELNGNVTPTYQQMYDFAIHYKDELMDTYLYKNIYHHLRARDVIIANTFKCTVKDVNNKIVGAANIRLTNDMTVQSRNRLVINNGTQIFKYDTNGLSPVHSSNLVPQSIQELSLTLYDEKGNAIENLNEVASISWVLPPVSESMIISGSNPEGDLLKFNFSVADYFSPYKTNNSIRAEAIYNGELISAETDFVFIKDGSSGTNGTDYYCRIMLNDETKTFNGFPMINYYKNAKKYVLNTYPEELPLTVGSTVPFKVALYNNGELITTFTSGIEWKPLAKHSTDRYAIPLKLKSNGEIEALVSADAGSNSSDFPTTSHRTNYLGVLQAKVSYNNKNYFAELPIGFTIIRGAHQFYNNYKVQMKKGTGYNEVVYASDGTSPRYASGENFEVSVVYTGDDGNDWMELTELNSGPEDCYLPLQYEWIVLGKDPNLLRFTGTKDANGKIIGNGVKFIPAESYTGEYCDTTLKCTVKNSGGTIVAISYFPIHFMLNKYGFAALNDWDGNGIQINEEEKYILSPQIGAGKKSEGAEGGNVFTGLFMGVLKESDNEEKVGLLGLHEGEQTIFLDANTGKAEFGKLGKGQIILDPSTKKAIIQGGNYSTSKKTGMLIDLTTPEIKFGSGKFEVNSSGVLTASGAIINGTLTAGAGSKIGGWNIGENDIYSTANGKVTKMQNQVGGDYAFVAGAPSRIQSDEAPFYVKHDGTLKATKATIEGKITATEGHIGGWEITSTRLVGDYVDGDTTYYNSFNRTGWTWAISIGSTDKASSVGKFRVKQNGEMVAEAATITGKITATEGKIGGWSIKPYRLLGSYKDGDITYYNSFNIYNPNDSANDWANAISIGATASNSSVGKFRVSQSGHMVAESANIKGTITASSGSIGNWTISSGQISNGNTTLKADGTITSSGGNFSGTITASGGSKIGNWIIEDGEIKSSAKNIRLISSGDNPRIICGKTTLFDGGTIRTPYIEIHPSKGMRVISGSTYHDCPEEIEIMVTDRNAPGGPAVCLLTFRRGLLVHREVLEYTS